MARGSGGVDVAARSSVDDGRLGRDSDAPLVGDDAECFFRERSGLDPPNTHAEYIRSALAPGDVNIFGDGYLSVRPQHRRMDPESYLTDVDAPTDRAIDFLDARELPPPEPLQETMTRLSTLDESSVFVQLNDRVPQFLFPKLDEQGITYRTVEADEGVVTAMWRPVSE